MLSIVVARGKNGVIGKDNKLLWHLSDDLRHFKALTDGHVIIMGRKTLESLPGLLPNREHWVLTNNPNYVPPYEGVKVFHSLVGLISTARTKETAYCIGGAQLYAAFLPHVERCYVTEVDYDGEGDAYFPALSPEEFTEVERVAGKVDEKNEYAHDFVVYERQM